MTNMSERRLEIERKLNITIHMPQVCVFCGEEITEKYGTNGDCLCFHSIDDNHTGYHMLLENSIDRRRKISKTKRDKSLYSNDEERVLYVIGRLNKQGMETTKTRLMQQTGWRKNKTKGRSFSIKW